MYGDEFERQRRQSSCNISVVIEPRLALWTVCVCGVQAGAGERTRPSRQVQHAAQSRVLVSSVITSLFFSTKFHS